MDGGILRGTNGTKKINRPGGILLIPIGASVF